MNICALVAGASLALAATACGRMAAQPRASDLEEAWDGYNDPSQLSDQYNVVFAQLPTSGQVGTIPWSDTYWPSYLGGIAQRWQSPSDSAFTYQLQTLAQLKAATPDQIKILSPAEKFDIFVGNYDYPTVVAERAATSPTDASWNGLCHGWSPASINFKEPQPVTLTGANGISVEFGSSDVKALLTYVQQLNRVATDSKALGQRCDWNLATDPSHENDPNCKGTNVGALHIVLANELGLNKHPFVADISRDYEIWNQPVYGFSTTLVAESTDVYATAAPGTVKIEHMHTAMQYVSEYGPSWNAVPASAFPAELTEADYDYDLEINASGQIIGGEWNEFTRPGFLWEQTAPQFTGYYAQLGAIYQASIQ